MFLFLFAATFLAAMGAVFANPLPETPTEPSTTGTTVAPTGTTVVTSINLPPNGGNTNMTNTGTTNTGAAVAPITSDTTSSTQQTVTTSPATAITSQPVKARYTIQASAPASSGGTQRTRTTITASDHYHLANRHGGTQPATTVSTSSTQDTLTPSETQGTATDDDPSDCLDMLDDCQKVLSELSQNFPDSALPPPCSSSSSTPPGTLADCQGELDCCGSEIQTLLEGLKPTQSPAAGLLKGLKKTKILFGKCF